jgi:ABC-type phosphate transport system substrate-binding protein
MFGFGLIISRGYNNMLGLNLRGSLLGSCAMAALALGCSNSALAQVTTSYTGGSTLAAKVYGFIFNDISTNPGYDTSVAYNYAAVGSGQGARAVLCNSPSQDNDASNIAVAFGASDNPLSATQVQKYNASQDILAGATGGSNPDCSSVGTGSYGFNQNGPLLQIASMGTPITVPFNLAHLTTNAVLTFTDAQLCGIFSGKITSWTDAALTTSPHKIYNGPATSRGVTLTPTGQITVVYRSDGSGTSALFTAHLNAVCTSTTSNISFTSTQTFAQLFSNTTLVNGPIPSNFTPANGSGSVQTAIGVNSTGATGAIGYLSPDYTQAAPTQTGNNLYAPVASVVNGTTGQPVQPDYADVVLALGTTNVPSPSSNSALSAGANATSGGSAYVPTSPNPSVGYPIVGYTTLIMPACYQDLGVVEGVYDFLNALYSNFDVISLLQGQGFVQLSGQLLTNINDNILNDNNNFHLQIENPTICQGNGASGAGTFVGR